MNRIDILLTSAVEGGMAPFRHDELELVFHQWTDVGNIPLLEGSISAFVDWVLPDISGLEVCRRLRCNPLTAQAHITMILEGNDAEERRRALRTGADDYMFGPVNRTVLLDRVLSLRSSDQNSGSPQFITQGNLTIDVSAFQSRWQGRPINLAPNEFRLLRFFVERPGRVFTRSQLITALGKQELPIDERTVDVWIGRLRRELKKAGAKNPIRTVRSLGYVYDES